MAENKVEGDKKVWITVGEKDLAVRGIGTLKAGKAVMVNEATARFFIKRKEAVRGKKGADEE